MGCFAVGDVALECDHLRGSKQYRPDEVVLDLTDDPIVAKHAELARDDGPCANRP
jgi:hypothetical protein